MGRGQHNWRQRSMSSSIPSALNPLASRREIKAISSAASSAADDPLRQEIAALKQRTAALQELKEKARDERPTRRQLKAQRDELRGMLEEIGADLASAPISARSAAPSSARSTKQPQSQQFPMIYLSPEPDDEQPQRR